MRPDLFQPTPLGEGRLLLLIDSFTTPSRSLEGRTKLAKLDFFLRYPAYLQRALEIMGQEPIPIIDEERENVETRMIRFRYGPWDPSYFSLIGSLIGRGLVEPIPLKKGVGYRTTDQGHSLAHQLARAPGWDRIADRTRVLKRHFNKSGRWLMKFIYTNYPEVTSAEMGEPL